jgi:hypothetical protein
MTSFWEGLWWLAAFAFIGIKLAGTALVAWSWWWVLLPFVPLFGLYAQHFRL